MKVKLRSWSFGIPINYYRYSNFRYQAVSQVKHNFKIKSFWSISFLSPVPMHMLFATTLGAANMLTPLTIQDG